MPVYSLYWMPVHIGICLCIMLCRLPPTPYMCLSRYINYNQISTLPSNVFANLTSLATLWVEIWFCSAVQCMSSTRARVLDKITDSSLWSCVYTLSLFMHSVLGVHIYIYFYYTSKPECAIPDDNLYAYIPVYSIFTCLWYNEVSSIRVMPSILYIGCLCTLAYACVLCYADCHQHPICVWAGTLTATKSQHCLQTCLQTSPPWPTCELRYDFAPLYNACRAHVRRLIFMLLQCLVCIHYHCSCIAF